MSCKEDTASNKQTAQTAAAPAAQAASLSTDTKSSGTDLKVATKLQLTKLRGKALAGKNGKGKMENAIYRLPVSFVMTNTSAGIAASVLNVDVTSSTEWTNLQALYDEYRFVKGHMQYYCVSPNVPGSSDAMTVVAFDPSDNTALTSVRNGCELSRHKLWAFPNVSGANGVFTGGKPMSFTWAPDKTPMLNINNSGAVAASAGQWKNLPTAGSNAAYDGYLKSYNSNTGANGTAQLSGIVTYWVEVRSRT